MYLLCVNEYPKYVSWLSSQMKPFLRPVSWLAVSAPTSGAASLSGPRRRWMLSNSGLSGWAWQAVEVCSGLIRDAELIPSPAARPRISFFGQGCSWLRGFSHTCWVAERKQLPFKLLLSLGSGSGPQSGRREWRALFKAALGEPLGRRLYSLSLCRFFKILREFPRLRADVLFCDKDHGRLLREPHEACAVWKERQTSAGGAGTMGSSVLIWGERAGAFLLSRQVSGTPGRKHIIDLWGLVMAGITALALTRMCWILLCFKQRSLVTYFNPRFDFTRSKEELKSVLMKVKRRVKRLA